MGSVCVDVVVVGSGVYISGNGGGGYMYMLGIFLVVLIDIRSSKDL